MRFRPAAAAEGAVWARAGFTAFARQPFGFTALFAICLLGFVVLLALPFIGPPLLVVLWPVVSLLFMMASRRAAAGTRPFPDALGELTSGRGRWGELLKLGLASLVVALLASFLIGWLDGGAFNALMERASSAKTPAESEALARELGPQALLGLALRLLFAALLSIPLWHAPPLVWWHGQRYAKALFFSTVAIWRNRGAFLVYGLAWAGVAFGFTLMLGVVAAVIGPAIAMTLAATLGLLWWTLAYASLWFTFAGCFETDPPAPPSTTARILTPDAGDPPP